MMKNVLGVCCGLLATTAVLAAQTPQTPSTSSTSQTTKQTTAQTVTITGCVTPDLTANPDPSSTTIRRFVLSNLEAQAGIPVTVQGYLLNPIADVNLSEHLNHKVQITGTVESSTTSSTSTTQSASPSTNTKTTTQSTTQTMPSFRVTSVKMVSATCP